MTYRESEKKIVKMRITLTRGEVDKIIRDRLVALGRVPPLDEKLFGRRLQAIDPVEIGERAPAKIDGKEVPWEEWPAYSIWWIEEMSK